MNTSAVKGFTLIELMTAVAVFGVLLSICVPSFTEINSAYRATSAANEFMTAVNLTRSEASKRGHPVTMCPANAAQSACVDSDDWSTGWIVFLDSEAIAGSVDSGETIIQSWPALNGITVYEANAAHFVRYTPTGSPDGLIESKFDLAKAGTNKYPRCISIAKTGRISLAKTTCV